MQSKENNKLVDEPPPPVDKTYPSSCQPAGQVRYPSAFSPATYVSSFPNRYLRH